MKDVPSLLFRSALGAGLIALIGGHYRIDAVRCAGWPPLFYNLCHSFLYLGAVALLGWAWLGWVRRCETGLLPLSRVLLYGVAVHLLALWGLPFLSDDPLFYAAVGRSMAHFHHGPHDLLRDSLPAGDPFLLVLPEAWQRGSSAYFAGFNALCAAIARMAGDHLSLSLRCYQFLGLCSMVGSAALVGLAAGPRGAALLLFCPLAIIEGTQGAHNDGLLALCTAGFALCVVRRRPIVALLALSAGLLVKASALLLLLFHGAQFLFARVRRSRVLLVGVVLILGGGLMLLLPVVRRFTQLVGSPADPYDYCTRSIECLPRVLLRWVLRWPAAAWGVGLVFRAAGGLLLLFAALRAGRDGRVLGWAANFLFLYYLYLHGWSQSWYFLPLLPLLPWAGGRLYPAMITLCLSACSYYALLLPWNCVTSPLHIAGVDLLEGLIVVVPPTLVLLRQGPASPRGAAAPGVADPGPG